MRKRQLTEEEAIELIEETRDITRSIALLECSRNTRKLFARLFVWGLATGMFLVAGFNFFFLSNQLLGCVVFTVGGMSLMLFNGWVMGASV